MMDGIELYVTRSPENLVIRPGQVSDLDAVMALETACFEPGVRESAEVYESRLLDFPAGFLVATHRDSSALVGYSTAERWTKKPAGEYDFTLNTKTREKLDPIGSIYYISSLAISADCRGQGIGELLLAESVTIARNLGCAEAILIVGAEWPAAIRLYQRLGFEKADVRTNFFQPTKGSAYDGLVMIKKLNSRA